MERGRPVRNELQPRDPSNCPFVPAEGKFQPAAAGDGRTPWPAGALDGAVFFFDNRRVYKIRGGDGREYGPITAQQIEQWIAEGRADGNSAVLAPGQREWQPLRSLPQFAFALSKPALPPRLSVSETTDDIPSYFWPSLLSTFCCCPPIGIVAAIYAARVNRRLSAGDRAGALDASRKARIWFWIALALGVIAYAAQFLLFRASGGLKIYR